MKTLKKYMYEGLLKGQQSTLADGNVEMVQAFLTANYRGKWTISETPNKNGLYVVSSDNDIVAYKHIVSLTNEMFVWSTVRGDFDCSFCKALESLKGAPKNVGVSFDCSRCTRLHTLEGSPKNIGEAFMCSNTAITSLAGAPKEVKGTFMICDCKSLESLNGCPKKVGGNFTCYRNKVNFSDTEIKAKCKVKGKIYC